MRVAAALLTLHGLQATVHFFRGLFITDRTELHLKRVLAAVKALSVVLRERVVFICEVQLVLDVLLAVKLVGVTDLASEAELAPPLLGDVLNLWREAVRVEGPLAILTEVELVLVRCFSAYFAGLAIQALPGLLVDALDVV